MLNYPPPTFSPDTGLFYINENNGLSVSYLMEPDPRGSMGLGGISGGGGVSLGSNIVAIDYKTGKIVWRKKINGGSPGLLSTAGGVLFVSNGQNVEAWDAADGQGPLVLADRRAAEPARDVHARRQAALALHERRIALHVRAELSSGDSRLVSRALQEFRRPGGQEEDILQNHHECPSRRR